MTQLNGVSNNSPAPGAASSAAPGSQPSTSAELDGQFMTLFLAQIQAQDPTEPMKNSEMVAQLAQISTVEQLELSNQNAQLQVMAQMSQANMNAGKLAGAEAEFRVNSVNWSEDTEYVTGTLNIDKESLGATQIVEVKEPSGKVIKSIEVEANENGEYQWKWDGTDDSGKTVDSGAFSISAKSKDTGENVDIIAKGTIEEIGYEPATHAVLTGGGSFLIGDIFKVYNNSNSN